MFLTRAMTVVDSQFIERLFRLPEVNLDRTTFSSARDIELPILQSGNVVLLGNFRFNPWVQAFEPRMNFYFADSRSELTNSVLINRSPGSSEQTTYVSTDVNHVHTEYGVVAFQPNLNGSGKCPTARRPVADEHGGGCQLCPKRRGPLSVSRQDSQKRWFHPSLRSTLEGEGHEWKCRVLRNSYLQGGKRLRHSSPEPMHLAALVRWARLARYRGELPNGFGGLSPRSHFVEHTLSNEEERTNPAARILCARIYFATCAEGTFALLDRGCAFSFSMRKKMGTRIST